ncbi:cAMP-dependent protein kinase catalytic subunit [Diplonema papillatum]|nr:cAMP-dependent protein kinase catalytic subunit [Diplonema papillatum]
MPGSAILAQLDVYQRPLVRECVVGNGLCLVQANKSWEWVTKGVSDPIGMRDTVWRVKRDCNQSGWTFTNQGPSSVLKKPTNKAINEVAYHEKEVKPGETIQLSLFDAVVGNNTALFMITQDHVSFLVHSPLNHRRGWLLNGYALLTLSSHKGRAIECTFLHWIPFTVASRIAIHGDTIYVDRSKAAQLPSGKQFLLNRAADLCSTAGVTVLRRSSKKLLTVCTESDLHEDAMQFCSNRWHRVVLFLPASSEVRQPSRPAHVASAIRQWCEKRCNVAQVRMICGKAFVLFQHSTDLWKATVGGEAIIEGTRYQLVDLSHRSPVIRGFQQMKPKQSQQFGYRQAPTSGRRDYALHWALEDLLEGEFASQEVCTMREDSARTELVLEEALAFRTTMRNHSNALHLLTAASKLCIEIETLEQRRRGQAAEKEVLQRYNVHQAFLLGLLLLKGDDGHEVSAPWVAAHRSAFCQGFTDAQMEASFSSSDDEPPENRERSKKNSPRNLLRRLQRSGGKASKEKAGSKAKPGKPRRPEEKAPALPEAGGKKRLHPDGSKPPRSNTDGPTAKLPDSVGSKDPPPPPDGSKPGRSGADGPAAEGPPAAVGLTDPPANRSTPSDGSELPRGSAGSPKLEEPSGAVGQKGPPARRSTLSDGRELPRGSADGRKLEEAPAPVGRKKPPASRSTPSDGSELPRGSAGSPKLEEPSGAVGQKGPPARRSTLSDGSELPRGSADGPKLEETPVAVEQKGPPASRSTGCEQPRGSADGPKLKETPVAVGQKGPPASRSTPSDGSEQPRGSADGPKLDETPVAVGQKGLPASRSTLSDGSELPRGNADGPTAEETPAPPGRKEPPASRSTPSDRSKPGRSKAAEQREAPRAEKRPPRAAENRAEPAAKRRRPAEPTPAPAAAAAPAVAKPVEAAAEPPLPSSEELDRASQVKRSGWFAAVVSSVSKRKSQAGARPAPAPRPARPARPPSDGLARLEAAEAAARRALAKEEAAEVGAARPGPPPPVLQTSPSLRSPTPRWFTAATLRHGQCSTRVLRCKLCDLQGEVTYLYDARVGSFTPSSTCHAHLMAAHGVKAMQWDAIVGRLLPLPDGRTGIWRYFEKQTRVILSVPTLVAHCKLCPGDVCFAVPETVEPLAASPIWTHLLLHHKLPFHSGVFLAADAWVSRFSGTPPPFRSRIWLFYKFALATDAAGTTSYRVRCKVHMHPAVADLGWAAGSCKMEVTLPGSAPPENPEEHVLWTHLRDCHRIDCSADGLQVPSPTGLFNSAIWRFYNVMPFRQRRSAQCATCHTVFEIDSSSSSTDSNLWTHLRDTHGLTVDHDGLLEKDVVKHGVWQYLEKAPKAEGNSVLSCTLCGKTLTTPKHPFPGDPRQRQIAAIAHMKAVHNITIDDPPHSGCWPCSEAIVRFNRFNAPFLLLNDGQPRAAECLGPAQKRADDAAAPEPPEEDSAGKNKRKAAAGPKANKRAKGGGAGGGGGESLALPYGVGLPDTCDFTTTRNRSDPSGILNIEPAVCQHLLQAASMARSYASTVFAVVALVFHVVCYAERPDRQALLFKWLAEHASVKCRVDSAGGAVVVLPAGEVGAFSARADDGDDGFAEYAVRFENVLTPSPLLERIVEEDKTVADAWRDNFAVRVCREDPTGPNGIGGGGASHVELVTMDGCSYALKTCFDIDQMQAEVQILRSLELPADLFPVFYGFSSLGNCGGLFLMEYLPHTANSFKNLNDRCVLSPPHAVVIFEQVAKALAYLHSKSFLHRDVKPHNILLDVHGRSRITAVKLADLGLVCEMRGKTGIHLGGTCTEDYAAPEVLQAKGSSAKSDVFSLAASVIELLCGVVETTDEGRVTSPAFLPNPNWISASVTPDESERVAMPPCLKQLLRNCLLTDVDTRWDTTTLLRSLSGYAVPDDLHRHPETDRKYCAFKAASCPKAARRRQLLASLKAS